MRSLDVALPKNVEDVFGGGNEVVGAMIRRWQRHQRLSAHITAKRAA
jgi:hypothetical protein